MTFPYNIGRFRLMKGGRIYYMLFGIIPIYLFTHCSVTEFGTLNLVHLMADGRRSKEWRK